MTTQVRCRCGAPAVYQRGKVFRCAEHVPAVVTVPTQWLMGLQADLRAYQPHYDHPWRGDWDEPSQNLFRIGETTPLEISVGRRLRHWRLALLGFAAGFFWTVAAWWWRGLH